MTATASSVEVETPVAPTGAPTGQAPSRQRRFARRFGKALFFWVISLGGGIGLWQLGIEFYHPASYIFPTPRAVWHMLWSLVFTSPSTPGSMWPQLAETVRATGIGWALGGAAGIILGVVSGEVPVVQRLIFPYLVALQSLPKVALMPLLATWFGFGLEAKVSLVILLVFFPVLINTLQGIVSADPELIDLTRSFSAGRWQRLWRIKLIGAASYIFVGLELGVTYAFLGAVLAEMTGSQSGIGVLIAQYQNSAATDATFAILVIMAITGFLLNSIVRFAHQRLVFWETSRGSRLAPRE